MLEHMRQELEHNSRAESQMSNVARTRGMVFGLIGGLVSTVVMDIVCVGMLLVMGMPAVVSFSTIGYPLEKWGDLNLAKVSAHYAANSD